MMSDFWVGIGWGIFGVLIWVVGLLVFIRLLKRLQAED